MVTGNSESMCTLVIGSGGQHNSNVGVAIVDDLTFFDLDPNNDFFRKEIKQFFLGYFLSALKRFTLKLLIVLPLMKYGFQFKHNYNTTTKARLTQLKSNDLVTVN